MRTKQFEDTDKQLDVREIEGEPFGDILAAVEGLSDDESLLLINSFEPAPLYTVLEDRGYEYETANPSTEVWEIKIEKA